MPILAVIPLDVDDVTVEDDLNKKDTATPLVDDFPGLVKVVNADEEDCSDVPYTSAYPNLPAKQQRKERRKVAWKKKNHVNKWSSMLNTEPTKLENLKFYLHDLTPCKFLKSFFPIFIYLL